MRTVHQHPQLGRRLGGCRDEAGCIAAPRHGEDVEAVGRAVGSDPHRGCRDGRADRSTSSPRPQPARGGDGRNGAAPCPARAPDSDAPWRADARRNSPCADGGPAPAAARASRPLYRPGWQGRGSTPAGCASRAPPSGRAAPGRAHCARTEAGGARARRDSGRSPGTPRCPAQRRSPRHAEMRSGAGRTCASRSRAKWRSSGAA